MRKKVLLIIITLLLPMGLLADELTLNKNAPKSYTVVKGDTLWDISGIFLKQPWLWPKLWRINPDISNPHLIYPGDVLRLVFDKDGNPMLVKGKPQLKWSPSIRTTLKDLSPVNTIPLNVVAPFIKYDALFSEDEYDNLPYVLGNEGGYKSGIDGIKAYVKGNLDVGQSYAIYEKGEEVFDPESFKSLGYYARLVGTAKAIRAGDIDNKEPSTLYIDSAKREIRSGDFVAPINEGQMLPSFFTMQAAKTTLEASIIKASSDSREFGKFEVVMINKGQQDEVQLGDVLSIKRQSPAVIETDNGPEYKKDTSRWNLLSSDSNEYKMPIESVGHMMVFKTYDEVSMALILSTSLPIRITDMVTAP
ncbi:LysM peptidoglycan-binding domain-containing protein [Pseudocolwellia sp. HL-MZ19]|uniref:LysM peptidoglycan-binding domain-containing protein n=1 Tax=unclassified Pseudocolwellia TaxID=2848178 RepID=UPI003CF551F6